MPKLNQAATNSSPATGDFLVGTSASGVDQKVTIASVLQYLYPVGSMYFNATNGANPSSLLGFGTWAIFSAGKMPVGVDSSDADFTAGNTGGEKAHALTGAENGVHNHGVNDGGHTHPIWTVDQESNSYPLGGASNRVMLKGGNPEAGSGRTGNAGANISIQNSGSGTPHNNMPPFVAVYIWRRTA